jgi:hypothetical protein
MATGSVSPKAGKIVNIPDQTVTIGTATDGGTGTTASVAFTAGSVTTGGPVNFYTATSTPGSLTANGSSSPITVSGLTTGTAYTFKVKAGNATGFSSAGESAASNSVTPAVPSSFESIASANGTGSSGVITFSSIPATYKHLQIRFSAFSSSENAAMFIRLNGDTGDNYAYHQLHGDGTTVGDTPSANRSIIRIADYGVMSQFGNPTVGIIDIHDYASTTKNKTVRTFVGTDKNNAYAQGVELDSGLWRSTSAITSVSITAESVNFTTATRFSLYGIKG